MYSVAVFGGGSGRADWSGDMLDIPPRRPLHRGRERDRGDDRELV